MPVGQASAVTVRVSPGVSCTPSGNLDAFLSVGYRVKSTRGTQFRRWANDVLRDHLLRGYTLNEKESPRARPSGSEASGRPGCPRR